MSLSRGVSKTACSATVSSTTPSPAPRWPPVSDTAEIVSALQFLASLLKLRIAQALKIGRALDPVEKRGVRAV